MTAECGFYLGLFMGGFLGMAVAILAVLPEYRRHERAKRDIVNR